MRPDTVPPMAGPFEAAPPTTVHHLLAAVLALVTAIYYGALMSVPTNDNFMHLALARQLRAGDVPVRDFFDSGTGLMYVLSAAADRIIGYRLLSEAVIVAVAAGLSAWLVFRLVVQLSQSNAAAVVAALLVLIAAPRGYAYPKLIVYAVAATLWWTYVRRPTMAGATMLGAWTAAAFYWRPDHGVYVAIGVALAALSAHRSPIVALRDSAAAAAVAAALVAPFLVFAYLVDGLSGYVAAGVAQAEAEHVSANGSHTWPVWPLRRPSDIVRMDAAETYAPEVTFRWSTASTAAERAALLSRYGLVSLGNDGPETERIRLSEAGVSALRELVQSPLIDDTAGIDRGAARIPLTAWGLAERARFRYGWLRVHLFPAVEEHTAAGEAVAAIWFLLPVLTTAAVVASWRRVRSPVSGQWLAFSLFCAVIMFGLVRAPYDVRAVDAVVPGSILFGCGLAAALRVARSTRFLSRVAATALLVLASIFVVKSVAVAGELGSRAGWLAGDWTSAARMRGAWREVSDRLVLSPPIAFWHKRAAEHGAVPGTVQLADYVRTCVPRNERTLVLWFAPEIYYYADRPAAARHLVFVRGWGALAAEQDAALRRVEHFSPPIVLATDGFDGLAGTTVPRVVDFVRRAYSVAGSLDADGEHYLVLARRDRTVVRRYGEAGWPCYNS